VTGDLSLVTRVTEQTNTHPWAKAGLMIRDTDAPGSRHVSVYQTPSNGVAFQYRSNTGGSTAHIAGPVTTSPTWLRLDRQANSFTAYTSNDGVSWQPISTVSVSLATDTLAGLAVTSHNDGTLGTARFANLKYGPLPAPAPSEEPAPTEEPAPQPTEEPEPTEDAKEEPFEPEPTGGITRSSVGSPSPAGSLHYQDGVYRLSGAGWDIESTSDSFEFAHQTVTGDLSLVTRVTEQTNTHPWAKAGLMIRDTDAPGSRHVSVYQTPSNGVAFQYRSNTGGSTAHIAGPVTTSPTWLRLDRQANSFTAYTSNDGVSWQPISTVSVSLATDTLAGLAVTSHNDGTLGTAGSPTSSTAPSPHPRHPRSLPLGTRTSSSPLLWRRRSLRCCRRMSWRFSDTG
jgi:regulation of enolase protein 1 (concanavalin A-like superfamily)